MEYQDFYTEQFPIRDNKGKAAQIYGIVALITAFVCCPLVGLILGIVAVSNASASKRRLGFLSDQASTGRILGVLAIVFSVLALIALVAYIVLVVLAVLAEVGGATGGMVI